MHMRFVFSVAACIVVTCSAYAGQIDVFFDSTTQQPRQSLTMPGYKVTVYQLDKSEALKAELNEKIPANLDDAAAFMRNYSNSVEGRRVVQSIVDGYQGVGKAFSLGVKRLPAVVIDERYVVYGTVDIGVALNLLEKSGGSAND